MAFTFKKRSATTVEARANQQGGGFEGFIKDEYRTFTPKNGDNAVRICPRDASEEAEHYGEDVWVHYSVGPDKAGVICLAKMFNSPCPVCEERQRAERRGDEEAVKALKPARRVLVWMIDRKNEDQGPLLWPMAWTVDRDISKAARDRETGAFYFIEDPDEGYDVYFDRSGNPPIVEYSGYQLARKPNSLSAKILDHIVKNPLLETLRLRDYDEVKKLFDGAQDKPEPKAEPDRRPALVRESSREEARERAAEQAADDAKAEREQEPPFDPDPPRESMKVERRPEPAVATATITGAERAAALRARFANRGA